MLNPYDHYPLSKNPPCIWETFAESWEINVLSSNISDCSNHLRKCLLSWVFSWLTLDVILNFRYCSILKLLWAHKERGRWKRVYTFFFSSLVILFPHFSKCVLPFLENFLSFSLYIIWLYINNLRYADDHSFCHRYGRKPRGTKEPLDESEKKLA